MLTRSTITTLALAIAGGGLWSVSGSRLADSNGFDYQPNPLGIKRSPYGQVLAMAIQTPIDADWHGGLEIHEHQGCGHGCDHDHGSCDHHGCDHDHEHSPVAHKEEHDEVHDEHGPVNPDNTGLALLDRLSETVSQRTNPNPPTPGHQLYLRQEIEKKLRFAYELDPSHYANYNCYHLFITQRELGTHGLPEAEVTRMIGELADYTIRYCLTEQNDPRPALTAASAAYNVLERYLTLNEGRPGDFATMRGQLQLMDLCLARHFDLLEAFIEDGSFEKLSSQRQEEILTRSKFATKLRDAAEKAIQRQENQEPLTADAS